MVKRIVQYWLRKVECFFTEHNTKGVFCGCTYCGKNGLD